MVVNRHVARSIVLFGYGFKEVHEWLDFFAMELGPAHRPYRHNKRGIQYVKKKWGSVAAQVATMHIMDDGYDSIDD